MKVRNFLAAAMVCASLGGLGSSLFAESLDSEIAAGVKFMKNNDFKKSAELFNHLLTDKTGGIKNHPKHAETWYLFSVSLRKLGRIDLADKALERAKALKKQLQTSKASQTADKSASVLATGSLDTTSVPADTSVDASKTAQLNDENSAQPSTGEPATSPIIASETGKVAEPASDTTSVPANSASDNNAYELASLKTDVAKDHHRKGATLYEAAQIQAAADEFLLAAAAEPDNIELLEKTILVLSQVGSGYHQKSISVFASLEKVNASKMTAAQKVAYARACIFSGKPDYKKAEAILSEVLKSAPENVEAIVLSAQFDSENKRFKQAIEKYEKVIKLDKSNIQAYLGLGEAYQKMQQFPKAIEVLQQARNIWPENFMPLVGLGKAYLKNGDYGFALVMFNLAYDMSPDNFDVNLGLIEIFARKGDYRAANHIARCEKFFKGDPRVEYWKAIFMEFDERIEDAKRIYSLLAMYEDDTAYRAKLRLGQLYANMGHETFPGNLLLADRPNFDRVYRTIDDQELAFTYFQDFIAKRPDAPEATSVRSWLDENEATLRNAREFDAFVQSQFKNE